ncbi:hypothetical protein, partial [Endozoicomonas sp. ONNA2]|uniref:YobI family P-loop NTPase n=1 Tax=Endozoicomonas sp. ONNA2 TaxID=2828741 RepID=UPI002148B79D
GSNENEKALLEQLLFSVTGKLPDEHKALQPQPRVWKKVTAVVAALLTSYAIATFGYLSGSLGIDQSSVVRALHLHLPDQMLAYTKKYAPLLAELSLLLVATLLILYLFTVLTKTSQKKRLTRQENSADKSDISHYLQQLNDALNHSRHDVVIVENLTSPCQLEALETLHCINGYLNGSGHVKQPIYFVYILADEILTASDRTRFFDLIIPIIPTLDAENVGPELYKQLKTIHISGQNVAEQMDKALIYSMASAIDDRRLKTNIVNEFQIYLEQFSNGHKALDKNKLFAMVVIKNLYPKEQAELTDDMGVFWQAFNDNKAPEKTVAERLQQGIMADSASRELTEDRFGPVLYLLENGYFAEDYRDYLFYFCSDEHHNENQLASLPPATSLPHPLEYQEGDFSRESSYLDDEGYANDCQVATQWQVSEAQEVWPYKEPGVNQYNPSENNLNIVKDISEDKLNFIAIPENTEQLALQSLPNNRDTFNLLMALINSEVIHDATLNQLLTAFPDFYLEQFNLTYLNPGRIATISQHPKCQFSFKSLEWLAKCETDFQADTTFNYLLRFWNEYRTNAVSTAQLTVNTVVKLLSFSEININDKLW